MRTRTSQVFNSISNRQTETVLSSDGEGIGSFDEEGADPVPANSVSEASFTATNGTTTQADLPASRPAPASRYRVRLVNTHADDRLWIGTTAAGAGAPTLDATSAVVEADYGIWEDYLNQNVAVWVKPVGSNSITVRLFQYAA